MTVDTNSKLTVVTQFIKGSDGNLEAIRRYYVQNGKVIPNSQSTIPGNPGNQIDEAFCKTQKVAFGDDDHFTQKGGLKQFTKAVAGPMVLVMSLWDDVGSSPLPAPRPRFLLTGGRVALRQHALA